MVRFDFFLGMKLLVTRGAVTGETGVTYPTLKSRGTSYVLVPLTFTTKFILIGWSPLHTNSFQRRYLLRNDWHTISISINIKDYDNNPWAYFKKFLDRQPSTIYKSRL